MLFAAVLIHAFHAALEDRVIAFDSVGRYDVFCVLRVADVFFIAMVHRVVARVFFAEIVIVLGFVGVHAAFARNVFANDRHNPPFPGARRLPTHANDRRGAAEDCEEIIRRLIDVTTARPD